MVKAPGILKCIYPEWMWEADAERKSIYLTFDDGPIPEVTPWVLDQLKTYNAEATFFCIGENVQQHPGILRKVVAEGHTVGNHTYNHLNGWKTTTDEYILNTLKCRQVMNNNLPSSTPPKNAFFRPPYGKIKPGQAKELQKRNFRMVMWSIISKDYDVRVSAETCYENVIHNARAGSIIVFHDSLKAEKNLRQVLPRVLEDLSQKGYLFRSL